MREKIEERAETGRKAEEIALNYLIGIGLRLLARNWRSGHREIDLIMESSHERRGVILHIVEVRSLREPVIHSPFETVRIMKQRSVIAAARSYIFKMNLKCDTQFDIVSIIFGANGEKIEYFPNAFTPTWR